MRVVIFLGKYSDWLEAYSIFVHFKNIKEARIYFKEDSRNNLKAVQTLYSEFKPYIDFSYIAIHNESENVEYFKQEISYLTKGDVLAAPFIRLRGVYCPFITTTRRKGIITVHLSEALPDSFGFVGYRFGFRMRGGFTFKNVLKQIISLPYMIFYSYIHRPDICFYELEPNVHNKFVKSSVVPALPKLSEDKVEFLKKMTNGDKRTLIVGGFGYKVQNIARAYKLSHYIATSKNKEIIIDGRVIALDYFICAEEVLLSGVVDRIIGYNSTAICWANFIGKINIICYDAKMQSEIAGHYFSYFSRKTLKKCKIIMLSQDDNLIDNCFSDDFTRLY